MGRSASEIAANKPLRRSITAVAVGALALAAYLRTQATNTPALLSAAKAVPGLPANVDGGYEWSGDRQLVAFLANAAPRCVDVVTGGQPTTPAVMPGAGPLWRREGDAGALTDGFYLPSGSGHVYWSGGPPCPHDGRPYRLVPSAKSAALFRGPEDRPPWTRAKQHGVWRAMFNSGSELHLLTFSDGPQPTLEGRRLTAGPGCATSPPRAAMGRRHWCVSALGITSAGTALYVDDQAQEAERAAGRPLRVWTIRDGQRSSFALVGTAGGDVVEMELSPNGDHIYWLADSVARAPNWCGRLFSSFSWVHDAESMALWVANADGSGARCLGAYGHGFIGPLKRWPRNIDWSPDGRRLAFEVDQRLYTIAVPP